MKAEKKNIIWDLSGTLFRPQVAGLSLEEQADFSLLFYMWSGKKEASKLDLHAIEVMNQAELPLPEYQVIRLHTGEPVPALVCSFLAGLINSQEALNKALHVLPITFQGKVTQEEFDQIKRMLNVFFNPTSLARCMQPIEITNTLLMHAAQDNKRLFILSNWDAESFDIFYRSPHAQTVFNYFDRKNILISADIGYIKPQPEMYEYFLSFHKVHPETCFFIDDQPENIEAAKTFGIDGIQFKTQNMADLLESLKEN